MSESFESIDSINRRASVMQAAIQRAPQRWACHRGLKGLPRTGAGSGQIRSRRETPLRYIYIYIYIYIYTYILAWTCPLNGHIENLKIMKIEKF